jgi:hypothetical protein
MSDAATKVLRALQSGISDLLGPTNPLEIIQSVSVAENKPGTQGSFPHLQLDEPAEQLDFTSAEAEYHSVEITVKVYERGKDEAEDAMTTVKSAINGNLLNSPSDISAYVPGSATQIYDAVGGEMQVEALEDHIWEHRWTIEFFTRTSR